MLHIRTYESAGAPFTRITPNQRQRLVFSPMGLPDRPNCVTPRAVRFYMDRVASVLGAKPADAYVSVFSRTSHRLTTVRPDALSDSPRSCAEPL